MFKKISIVCILFMISACGTVVEQNELALVFSALGNREAKVLNKQDEINTEHTGDSNTELSDNFSVELMTAKRAPIATGTKKVLIFPLGLHSYVFSKRASPFSLHNEEITIDSEGGKISFDLGVHMMIDDTFPDIKDRLVLLTKEYQLRRYSGSRNVLSELIQGRFAQQIKKPFIEYGAGKSALTIMNSKSIINKIALDKMNARFNKYGLRFTMVSILSAERVSEIQQEKMNNIVLKDVGIKILQIDNDDIKPIEETIAKTLQDTLTQTEGLLNTAKAAKISLIARAEKIRKKTFIDLVTKENYVRLELMMGMVKNLGNSNTKITILPEHSRIMVNTNPSLSNITGE